MDNGVGVNGPFILSFSFFFLCFPPSPFRSLSESGDRRRSGMTSSSPLGCRTCSGWVESRVVRPAMAS